ncbi:MAG: CoA transferase, partial [Alicyclobacillus sp.]|nr:CoA transferase [Alicyclobacillus sp.]
DLGTRIAAPFAATLLAEFGAEVYKVELPRTGDFLRQIGPFVDDYSLWWAVDNRCKKSITLDLRQPAGREVFLKLVPKTDVIVENFPVTKMSQLSPTAQKIIADILLAAHRRRKKAEQSAQQTSHQQS